MTDVRPVALRNGASQQDNLIGSTERDGGDRHHDVSIPILDPGCAREHGIDTCWLGDVLGAAGLAETTADDEMPQ